MKTKVTSKAGKSRQTKSVPKKGKTKNAGQFKPNDPVTGEKDTRINRTGQNAKFTEFRHMVNSIFGETITPENQKDGKKVSMSRAEMMVRNWISSEDYQKQAKALEYSIGKVPDEMRVHSDIEGFIKQNLDLFSDRQLTRLQSGENPLDIIAELLRDLLNKKRQA